MQKPNLFSIGLAIFAMLFGAGNVVFPLIVGRDSGIMLSLGLLGFLISAVIVPLLGLISVMLSEGDYQKFFLNLGEIPGKIIVFISMILIGPFALTARCVTISYASISPYIPKLTLFHYSIVAACIIFFITIKKDLIMDILGKVLGPIKLLLLSTIIIVGILHPAKLLPTNLSPLQGLMKGLSAGYGTADLFGTIFFSALIFAGLTKHLIPGAIINYHKVASWGFKSGVLGASLIGIIYSGFCVTAAFNAQALAQTPDSNVFSMLSRVVLGSWGGFFANITLAISTLTTAIALNVVFAQYVAKYLLNISYFSSLIYSIVIIAIFTNLGFSGIMNLAMPVISTLYPMLIVLSVCNILRVFYGFTWTKHLSYATLLGTIAFKMTFV
jgi:branched-chain amino acid:cation transporter, LIVCS family